MSEQPGSGRLDAELLAAYLDGQLPPEDRARVEAQLAEDPEAHEWVVNALAMQAATAHAEPAPVVPFHRRRRVQVGVGALLAVAAALVLAVRLQPAWWLQITGSGGVDPRFAGLVAAVGEERHVEGRLTGGFKYGPLRPVTRGPDDLRNQNLALLAAAGEWQRAVQADPTPENLHGWGVAQALLGDYDEAIDTLRRAQESTTLGGRLPADLAAVLLGRARAQGNPADIPAALELAERALMDDPGSAAAAFTRAEALERLHLIPQAIEAWEAYLRLDQTSGWADEARRRVAALRQTSANPSWDELRPQLMDPRTIDPMVASSAARRFPQDLREFIEDELLATWAQHRNPAESLDPHLAGLARLAAELAASGGDRGPLSTVEHVLASDSATRARLAHGFVRYSQGRRLVETERIQDAAGALTEAARVLARAGSPLAWAARYGAAQVEYYAGNIPAFVDQCELLLSETESRTDAVAQRGRIRWGLGLARAVTGDFVGALPLYQSALGDFQQVHEVEHVAFLHHLLAEVYGYLADPTLAWGERIAALEFVPSMRTARRRQAVLISAALLAERSGHPAAAATFTTAAVDYARLTDRPAIMVEVLARRARLRALAGDFRGAHADIVAARQRLATVNQPGLNERLEGEVLDAELEAAADAETESEAAARAIAFFEGRKTPARAAQLWLSLGRIRARRGDSPGAVEAFRSGLAHTASRPGAAPLPWHVGMREEARALSGALARALWDVGQPIEALDALLRTRGLGAAVITPAGPSEAIRTSMAPRDALLVVSAGAERTLAWLVTRDQVHLDEPRTTTSDLTRLGEGCRANLADGSMAARTACEALFRLLIGPHTSRLATVDRLFVSIDEAHQYVPFGWLREPSGGGRLFRKHAVVVVTGARDIVQQLKSAPEWPSSVLAVGVTASPWERVFLPNAGPEALGVAASYARSVTLVGDAATRSGVVAALDKSDVLHFAGHSIDNRSYPGLSRLLLAGDRADAVLYAFELPALGPTMPRTVVLASCRSAAGATPGTAAPFGLAFAFLKAGAERVVASVSDVPDADSAAPMQVLHRHLAAGVPAERALAEIQRTSEREAGDNRAVAGMQVYW